MILLLGGTSETAELAEALAEACGLKVLVSTATDAELAVGRHELISRRCGRLNEGEMCALVKELGVRAIVDGAHPFAIDLHLTADRVALKTAVPLLRFQRSKSDLSSDNIHYVDTHDAAAALAASLSLPILLTTGSRNLAPYVKATEQADVPLFARVLPHPDSVAACDEAALSEENRIFARGPFTTEATSRLLQGLNIGVLITKESGQQGGFPEKIEAARMEGCQVIVIRRPDIQYQAATLFSDVVALVESARQMLA